MIDWNTLKHTVAQRFPEQPLEPDWKSLRDFLDDVAAQAEAQPGTICLPVLAAALLAVGPRNAGAPPAELWEHVQDLIASCLTQQSPERWLEVLVAYGCGWGRAPAAHLSAWHARWEPAIWLLAELVERSIRKALRDVLRVLVVVDQAVAPIYRMLGSHRTELDPGDAALLAQDAMLLTLELVHSRCECSSQGHSRQTRSGPAGPLRAGCAAAHRLASWNPEQMLRAFVAQAVRGDASDVLKTGAFATSMFYRLLEAEVGVRVGVAEFKLCGHCHAALLVRSRPSGRPPSIRGLRTGLYEGSRCPTCGQPAQCHTTYTLGRKNWLLLPYGRGGRYVPTQRRRCPNCANLYPPLRTDCPRCGETRLSQRTTEVWVQAVRQVDLASDPESGFDETSEDDT